MEGHGLDNDIRGWIMSSISGIACVVGSSVICIDLLLRYIPGWMDFRIQDNRVFLACSMSLSFGVMIFSALFSILPSSKKYLEKGGVAPSKAAWLLFGFFVAGFAGIQILSRFLHRYIPSHVVDCDHTHDEASTERIGRHAGRSHSHMSHSHSRHHSHGPRKISPENIVKETEVTPLLARGLLQDKSGHQHRDDGPAHSLPVSPLLAPIDRRPSMVQVQSRVMSFVKDVKLNCDEAGPCFGYSEPCGQECFKQFPNVRAQTPHHPPTFLSHHPNGIITPDGLDDNITEPTTADISHYPSDISSHGATAHACHSDSGTDDIEAQHHHHVPENAFMSIGLQTSIAIAMHKLPEGFITYATNHASPSLGFSVFTALFIHNITEGFAMALPLYLALGSRFKAMFWSSLLGGISQPLGAGTAALWFAIDGHRVGSNEGPGFAVYGCMFAITAGILTSVALQLFVEGLGMCHRKELCIGCAFLGMSILAMANALTAQ